MTHPMSAMGAHLRALRWVGLGLCGMVAACQRPTQLLPPAPIFEIQTAQGPLPRDNDRAASSEDFGAFAGPTMVYFERGRADLDDAARGVLDRQADWLRHHPEAHASLQGHADALGTRAYQIALGEKRASAMKFYLTARGVAADRLATTSFGKQKPAALGLDEASQKMNRRGETVLIGLPGASGK